MVALIVAVVLGAVGRHTGRFAQRSIDMRSAFVAPPALPFSIAIVGILTVGVGACSSPPVPPEAGLDLIVYNKNEPGKPNLLLFIHGWRGDATQTWKQFPALAATDSALAQYNVWSVDYPTFMFKRNLRVGALASPLNRALEKADAFKYQRVVIIAHSMGGLISRQIVIIRRLNGQDAKVAKLIEVATPHLGGKPALIARTLGVSDELADDMVAGSGFLSTLTANWNALSPRPATFCVGSPQDAVVSQASATYQCDRLDYYTSGGHTDIVKPSDRTEAYYYVPIEEVP